MSLSTIAFDADGTLIDTADGSVRATQRILLKNHCDLDPNEVYARWKTYHQHIISTRSTFTSEEAIFVEGISQIYYDYGIAGNPREDVHIMLATLGRRKVFADTPPCLQSLRGRFELVIASNTDSLPLSRTMHAENLIGETCMALLQRVPGPISVTDRLLMRPFQWSDLDVLAALASDPDVMRYIGNGPETREEVTQGVERAIRRWYEQGMSWWAVLDRHDARVIGRCCLQHVRDLPEVEVGCAFACQHWGRGLASEAVRAALDHGFRVLGLQTIVALTHPDNVRSRRMLERCGFMLEATIPLRGKHLNLYRMAAQTWAECSAGSSASRWTRTGIT